MGIVAPASLPGKARAVSKLPARTVILDGEVCAFDANLVSHVSLLEASPEELPTPPVFMAFDCLDQRGRDLRDRPLAYRRQALEDRVQGSRLIYAARRLQPHGLDAWAEVKQHGYEGLVAKARELGVQRDRPVTGSKSRCGTRGSSSLSGLTCRWPGSCTLLLAARAGRKLAYVGAASGA